MTYVPNLNRNRKQWPSSVVSAETLMRLALEARENAYAPYSGFKVGAACLSERDEIAVGCNVENASYGLTQCAERSALASSRVSGHAQTVAIAVAGEASRSCFPCGACRQVIYERNPRMLVVVVGKITPEVFAIDELLPFAFDMRKEDDNGTL